MLFLLYQFLLLWKGNEVEVVWVDKQPFTTNSDAVEASYYDQDFGPIKLKGCRNDGTPKKIYMESKSAGEIQDKASSLIQNYIHCAL